MLLQRLCYASASILILALAYQHGARSAQAQSGGQIDGAAVATSATGVRASGAVGRVFHLMLENGTQRAYAPPVPGTQAILATDPLGIGVLLADGQVLQFNGSGWTHTGDLIPVAVPAALPAWGQVKDRYRK